MIRPSSKPAIDAAAARLRAIVLESEAGAFIGSEDALLARLGSSRSTLRQVARLLEREGLLRVRRGINGGYFGARPDIGTIERTVSGYLEMVDVDPRDVTMVASALWVEVLGKAAALRTEAARTMADSFRERVLAVKPGASLREVGMLEQESRAAIFDLINSRYVELIFAINTTLAGRFPPREADDTPEHREFVRAWRNAKLMELSAIAEGDVELGLMAARHSREIWHKRFSMLG